MLTSVLRIIDPCYKQTNLKFVSLYIYSEFLVHNLERIVRCMDVKMLGTYHAMFNNHISRLFLFERLNDEFLTFSQS